MNPWPLLRAGKVEQDQGLQLVRQAYTEQPYASEAMTLGVSLLWLGRFAEAGKHFQSVIETLPQVGDGIYGMAGVANWCLGRPDKAALQWRAGLQAKYARASGFNVRMPLLLFFAAVRQPNVFAKSSAEKLIRAKTGDIRIRNWPGPIARLVIDQISESEFQDCCLGIKPGDTGKNSFRRYNPQEASNSLWLAEFYRSVLALNHGGLLSDFKNSMRKLADTTQAEWRDENVFTTRIWHEEFFLARHEAMEEA